MHPQCSLQRARPASPKLADAVTVSRRPHLHLLHFHQVVLACGRALQPPRIRSASPAPDLIRSSLIWCARPRDVTFAPLSLRHPASRSLPEWRRRSTERRGLHPGRTRRAMARTPTAGAGSGVVVCVLRTCARCGGAPNLKAAVEPRSNCFFCHESHAVGGDACYPTFYWPQLRWIPHGTTAGRAPGAIRLSKRPPGLALRCARSRALAS
jgi:hypothetical protein